YVFLSREPSRICNMSLHDALPICLPAVRLGVPVVHLRRGLRARNPGTAGPSGGVGRAEVELIRLSPASGSRPGPPAPRSAPTPRDRKSTRLNSSHVKISYAVFCL